VVPAVECDHRSGEPTEASSILTQSVGMKHLQHRGSGALDDGDACQQCRALAKQ
jgi:hypothetical protein